MSPEVYWRAGDFPPGLGDAEIASLASRVREPTHVIRDGPQGRIGIAVGGLIQKEATPHLHLATLPPMYPEWLGDRSFCEAHQVRYPYIAGEMANGIATVKMVIAMGRAQMLGFFGAAGLSLQSIGSAVDALQAELGNTYAWGVNLIHSPNEAALEDKVVELLLQKQVRRVSASAFMTLTPAVVRYCASGLTQDGSGQVQRRNFVFAKLSRVEVAQHFMSPAPKDMLQALVDKGLLTANEAQLAARVPVAEDITVEADSGGHTDNQAMTALFPTMLLLRDRLVEKFAYQRPLRVGAAGGLATPSALAAAFGLGAAYVLTGSINQCAVESGLADAGKQMLAQADIPDVAMAPSADMFELGVKVQVLKRGTMFAVRAAKLYEVYTSTASLEAIAPDTRARLEKEIFQAPLASIWDETKAFWLTRDPAEVTRAENDPKHRMALVFRWYLGNASRWAITGTANRRTDFQIWCGPAMGAFNAWSKGSFLAELSGRTVVQIALNLLEGAAVVTRAHQLRTYGVAVPNACFHFPPRPLG